MIIVKLTVVTAMGRTDNNVLYYYNCIITLVSSELQCIIVLLNYSLHF